MIETVEESKNRTASAAFWIAAVFTILLFARPNEIIQSWHFSGIHRIFGIMAVFACLFSMRGRLGGVYRDRLILFYLLHMAAILTSIPFSAWPGGSFFFFADTILKQAVILFVLVIVLRQERYLIVISKMIVYSTLIVAVYTIVVFWGGEKLVEGYRAGLVQGVFKDPNDLSLHFVFAIPLAYFVVLRTAKRKWIPTAVIACLCAGVLATFSRGGMIGLAAVVLAVLYFDREKRKWNLLIAGAAMITVITAFPPVVDRISTMFGDKKEASQMQRWGIMKKGVVIFMENPLVGVGIRSFAIVEGSTHSEGEWKDAHNSMIQVAAETGIFGLAGFVACLFLIMAAPPAGRSPTARLRLLQAGVKSSAIGYIVCSMFLSQAYSWYFIYLIGLTLSINLLTGEENEHHGNEGGALVAA